MPLYDYHCRSCGRQFELLVRAGDSPACPGCRGTVLDRLPSAPVPPGKSKAIMAANRKRAVRAGHLSNFSPGERAGPTR